MRPRLASILLLGLAATGAPGCVGRAGEPLPDAQTQALRDAAAESAYVRPPDELERAVTPEDVEAPQPTDGMHHHHHGGTTR